MMRYIQRIDGEGFEVEPGKITRWACCDCGLVHDIAFVIEGDAIGVAAERNERATAQRRRNSDGYSAAFYELAKMLDLPACPKSPKEVWETVMRPRLQTLIDATTPQSNGE